MSALVIDLAQERARRTVGARFFLGRPLIWWGREAVTLAALLGCVWLLLAWIY